MPFDWFSPATRHHLVEGWTTLTPLSRNGSFFSFSLPHPPLFFKASVYTHDDRLTPISKDYPRRPFFTHLLKSKALFTDRFTLSRSVIVVFILFFCDGGGRGIEGQGGEWFCVCKTYSTLPPPLFSLRHLTHKDLKRL